MFITKSCVVGHELCIVEERSDNRIAATLNLDGCVATTIVAVKNSWLAVTRECRNFGETKQTIQFAKHANNGANLIVQCGELIEERQPAGICRAHKLF